MNCKALLKLSLALIAVVALAKPAAAADGPLPGTHWQQLTMENTYLDYPTDWVLPILTIGPDGNYVYTDGFVNLTGRLPHELIVKVKQAAFPFINALDNEMRCPAAEPPLGAPGWEYRLKQFDVDNTLVKTQGDWICSRANNRTTNRFLHVMRQAFDWVQTYGGVPGWQYVKLDWSAGEIPPDACAHGVFTLVHNGYFRDVQCGKVVTGNVSTADMKLFFAAATPVYRDLSRKLLCTDEVVEDYYPTFSMKAYGMKEKVVYRYGSTPTCRRTSQKNAENFEEALGHIRGKYVYGDNGMKP